MVSLKETNVKNKIKNRVPNKIKNLCSLTSVLISLVVVVKLKIRVVSQFLVQLSPVHTLDFAIDLLIKRKMFVFAQNKVSWNGNSLTASIST